MRQKNRALAALLALNVVATLALPAMAARDQQNVVQTDTCKKSPAQGMRQRIEDELLSIQEIQTVGQRFSAWTGLQPQIDETRRLPAQGVRPRAEKELLPGQSVQPQTAGEGLLPAQDTLSQLGKAEPVQVAQSEREQDLSTLPQDTIVISCAQDLGELSRNCSLDSWSVGKTVLLACDVDLTGSDFAPIPTFGGMFDGQGHVISGLDIEGSGNIRGLFRYVQESGVVKDLTVRGSVLPTGRKSVMGGIVGSNSGKIMRCAFLGVVKGEDVVGGVVGVNEASGTLINCSFSGSVVGEHYVGGIAGQNFGALLQCENGGHINTTEVKSTLELKDVELRQLGAMENAPVCTDIGGIAGFSSGVLQSCQNDGPVGYEHVGYNVGGIAGRQSGYLDGCLNRATVRGRKDVGGIAGQMEPKLTLKYNQSTLDSLWDELDTLQGQLDRALNHAQGSSNELSAHMQKLTDNTRAAKDAAGDLSDALTEWADGNLDEVNELSTRLSWALDQMTPVLDFAQRSLSQLQQASGALYDAMEDGQAAASFGKDAVSALEDAMAKVQQAAEQGLGALSHVRAALQQLRTGLGDEEQTDAAAQEAANGFQELEASIDALSEATPAALASMGALLESAQDMTGEGRGSDASGNVWSALSEGIGVSLSDVSDALKSIEELLREGLGSIDFEKWKKAAQELEAASEALSHAVQSLTEAVQRTRGMTWELKLAGKRLDQTLEHLLDAADSLESAFSLLRRAVKQGGEVVRELSDKPAIHFDSVEGRLTQPADALDDAVSGLLDGVSALGDTMTASSDALIADMRAINAQIGAIVDVLRQTTQPEDESLRDRFEDVSDKESAEAPGAGVIAGCKNEGPVQGDVNVAGVVGSMAVEYDFDPEDDLTKNGDRTLDFRYQALAVVRHCVNEGRITAKKDCVGGIVGRMDLGSATACEGYGDVLSTDGDYVGGVVGASYAVVRDCLAKCALSGEDYVGGIAGYGGVVAGCSALVEIEEGKAFLGAVAGNVEGIDDLTDNFFVHETLGAIDGVSYAGKAQPMTFEQLCALRALPEAFTQFALTFVAQDEVVACIPFQYGDGLATLPDLPPVEGCFGEWPDLDYAHLTFSRTLEAVYTPYASALSTGGELPDILVDGSFGGEAKIAHTTQQASWTDAQGRAHTGMATTVTVEDPVMREISYTVHYRLQKQRGGFTLWVETPAGWEERKAQIDGSYLLLQSDSKRITFCVETRQSEAILLVAVVVLCAAVLGCAAWVRRQQKARRHKEKDAQEKSHDE